MFDRIRRLFQKQPASAGTAPGVVAHWATARFLQYRSKAPHAYQITGQLQDRAWRVECATTSRPYIAGLELRARVDLELPPVGHVIVLSRTLLRTLEAQAEARYDHGKSAERQRTAEMPEELRWLERFPEVSWPGPGDVFWRRYAVLSDAPELARRWIDDEAQAFLLAGSSEAAGQVPVLVAFLRGKCYLRLQVNPHAQEADALLALELLEYLSARALALAARSGH